MSVTFSGAFTFTGGGFTATLAPPTTATAGWWGAGQNITSVQRITFATDTATATIRGPLNASSYFYGLAAAGTLTNGWYGGGTQFGVGAISIVNRITYATDTATATTKGPLSLARSYLGATSDGTTYGWFGGGAPGNKSTVDRITYATDTDTASIRGPLSGNRSRLAGTGISTDGYFGGGYSPATGFTVSTINRITYATDTDTASVKGPLNIATGFLSASTDGTTYGWFGGGDSPYSVVQRITYANDTATASLRGPLSSSRYGLTATGDSTYGWFGGGRDPNTPGGVVTTVDRITYATDTATASIRGPLNTQTTLSGAAAGVQ